MHARAIQKACEKLPAMFSRIIDTLKIHEFRHYKSVSDTNQVKSSGMSEERQLSPQTKKNIQTTKVLTHQVCRFVSPFFIHSERTVAKVFGREKLHTSNFYCKNCISRCHHGNLARVCLLLLLTHALSVFGHVTLVFS